MRSTHGWLIVRCCLLFFCLGGLTNLQGKERTIEEFREYVARRLTDVEPTQLAEYLAQVDRNEDGIVSEEEFKSRVNVFLKVFQRIDVKPQKLGSSLPDNWLVDWEEAQKISAETGRPILAMFSASWCGPCKRMIATVYPTDEAKAALADFVPVYIDSEKHRELAKANDIRAFPTFKCFTPDGEMVADHVGGNGTDAFISLLGKFKTEVRSALATQQTSP